MQEFALFAVLLKERPYKNPYIADGTRQELVEPAVARPIRPKALYTGSIRRVAQAGIAGGIGGDIGGHTSGTEVASVGQPQTISPQKSR